MNGSAPRINAPSQAVTPVGGGHDFVTRAAELTPTSINEAARTVECVWSTGARVLRSQLWDEPYHEELSLDPSHVRMERLASGRAPFLDNHNASSAAAVIGVVEQARLELGRGVATIRFAEGDEDAESIWNKVKQGILRNISVGYRVYRWMRIGVAADGRDIRRAEDWEPYELSVVGLGSDAAAHFRSEEEPNMKNQPNQRAAPAVTTREVTAERHRAAEIVTLVRAARLDQSLANEMIHSGVSLDAARATVLDRLASMDERTATRQHLGDRDISTRPNEEGEQRVRLMAEALAARNGGGQPSEEARQYLRMRTVDMARTCLETRGVSTRLLSDAQIISRGLHTTSDFPALLQETGSRILRQGYGSYPGGVRRICRESSAPDFRAKSRLMLGEAPELKRVNEHGEFTRGTMAESKASYALATYGRIFGITRQALVNDDLGAFAEMTHKLGRAAAEFVAQQLAKLLAGNPQMADGVALFHANHGNVGTAGLISIATLGEALKLMRLQKGLDGTTPIDATPRFLVVPASIEIIARQHVAQINANSTSEVNPFTTDLEVVVDPRLDAHSATAWYLAADPNVLDTIEFSFLEGAMGPEIETRSGFDVDGAEMKVRLDFGAGVIDHRGLVKNAGA